jgi:hypothetical protein
MTSLSQGPTVGASFGRSWIPTVIVRTMTAGQHALSRHGEVNAPAERIETTPIHPSAWIRPSVWIEPMSPAAIAETATKMAVQAPWVERALRATLMLSIPAPAAKIMTGVSEGSE